MFNIRYKCHRRVALLQIARFINTAAKFIPDEDARVHSIATIASEKGRSQGYFAVIFLTCCVMPLQYHRGIKTIAKILDLERSAIRNCNGALWKLSFPQEIARLMDRQ